jgi:HAE1 family hydrophobic/amphiphilic exporter-1
MRHLLLISLAMTVSATAADLPSAIARVGVSVTEKKLTMAEAIEMALANNLDIEIERTNRDQAETAIRIAKGAFDPRMQFQPGYASNNTPTGSVLQGVNGKLSEDTSTENFYFREKFPWWGSSFEVDFTNGRTSTTNLFSSLNPYFNSQLLVNFTLPLLRNREIDQDRANILVRRKQLDVSLKDFEIRVIDIVTTVQQAYWDLVAAREDVGVQADAVGLAAKQLAQNQRMIQSGTLAPIELSASEAELERRKDTYYTSVETLTEAENNLKTLLLPDRRSETWSDQIVPVDTQTVEPLTTDDVHEAVADALRRRPEIRQVELRKDANQIDQRLNSNQIKPQVNFVSSYTSTGLGGAISTAENPFNSFQPLYDRLNQLSVAAGLAPVAESSLGSLPGSLIGGYGTTLAGLFGGNYQSVQAGLQLDFTARNRTAQGNYTNSLIEAKRLKFEQSRTEQAIEAQVRNALQAIQTARQRITSAEAGERAAREKLESETRLFQTGESTNFFVLTRQDEYLDARRRAVLAHLDFNKAVARLEQAVGNTLANHGVTLR